MTEPTAVDRRTGRAAVAAGVLLSASVAAELVWTVQRPDGTVTNLAGFALYLIAWTAGAVALVVGAARARRNPVRCRPAPPQRPDRPGDRPGRRRPAGRLRRGRPGHRAGRRRPGGVVVPALRGGAAADAGGGRAAGARAAPGRRTRRLVGRRPRRGGRRAGRAGRRRRPVARPRPVRLLRAPGPSSACACSARPPTGRSWHRPPDRDRERLPGARDTALFRTGIRRRDRGPATFPTLPEDPMTAVPLLVPSAPPSVMGGGAGAGPAPWASPAPLAALPTRAARCCSCWPTGCPTGRSRGGSTSARRRSRAMSHGCWRRSGSGTASRRSSSPSAPGSSPSPHRGPSVPAAPEPATATVRDQLPARSSWV